MWVVVMPERALAIQQPSPSQRVSKDAGPHSLSFFGTSVGPASQSCIAALAPWKNHQRMGRGVPLGMVYKRKVVSTGLWSKKESYLHIKCLEMLAVCLGLRPFLWDLRGHHVLLRSDSMMAVSNINYQGSLSLRRLFILAEHLLRWAQLNLRSLRATHVPGKLNLGADMLSRSNVQTSGRSTHKRSGLSRSLQPRGQFPWDETSSLSWTDGFGTPRLNYGRYIFGLSMGAFRPSRECAKYYFSG